MGTAVGGGTEWLDGALGSWVGGVLDKELGDVVGFAELNDDLNEELSEEEGGVTMEVSGIPGGLGLVVPGVGWGANRRCDCDDCMDGE